MPLQNPIRQWETLAQALIKDELGRTLLEQWGQQAWQQLEERIARHPYLRERSTFEKGYLYALWWLVLQQARKHNQLSRTSSAQLGRSTGVKEQAIRSWFKDQIKPLLLEILIIHEGARQEWEGKLPRESQDHRLDPSPVYHAFTPTRDPEQRTPQKLATIIKKLLHDTPNQPNILFAELHPYHRQGPQWPQEVASSILAHRIEIEQLLNQQLNLDTTDQTLHLGVVNNTLYLWLRCTHPDNWLNIYAKELFYFHSLIEKQHLKKAAYSTLGFRNFRNFSQLVTQITNYPTSMIPKDGRSIRELDNQRPHLRGELLHFLLDITSQTLEDIQPQIKCIGKRSQVSAPQFPKIDSLRARLLATMLSDGHINKVDCLLYAEKIQKRREIVIGLVNQLGEVKHYYTKRKSRGITGVRFPGVIGRLMERWGMPRGDRNIQNIGLPPTITRGTPKTKRAYLEELIPEDGTFVTDSKHFAWTRGVILTAGSRADKYPAFKPKLAEEDTQFISKHGKPIKLSFGSNTTTNTIQIRWNELKNLTESTSSETQSTAQKIIKTILENPSHLMEDEVAICESLRIQVKHDPTVITKWPSGRTSVSWVAHTTSVDEAVRWALLVPPNDRRKRADVEVWLADRRAKGLLNKELETHILKERDS